MDIIIVEDELHNVRLLKGMLQKLRPEWEVLDDFDSVADTVKWLQENSMPKLIFMDIQLTDGNCFSIFEKVDVSSMVVFTTAYDEYAIQSFKVNSIDYLLKPLKEQELEKAIEKFEKIYSAVEKAQAPAVDYSQLLEALSLGQKKYKKRFLVAGVSDFFKINSEDVAYFYTQNRTSFAVTYEGKEHVIDYTMEKLEQVLDPELFFRANRSYIINSEAIRKFESYFGGKLIVRLINPFKESVTVSRLKAAEFKEWMDR